MTNKRPAINNVPVVTVNVPLLVNNLFAKLLSAGPKFNIPPCTVTVPPLVMPPPEVPTTESVFPVTFKTPVELTTTDAEVATVLLTVTICAAAIITSLLAIGTPPDWFQVVPSSQLPEAIEVNNAAVVTLPLNGATAV